MKFVVLHGAVKNAGDYLILNRTIELLNFCYPNCEILKIYRNSESLEDSLHIINDYDMMIIAGGPGYTSNFYPNVMPLVSPLERIRIPIGIVGMGANSIYPSSSVIQGYSFDNQMKQFLDRSYQDIGALSGRDYITTDILRNNGYENAIMTGCPAWYNLSKVNEIEYCGPEIQNATRICISNPGHAENNIYAMLLVSEIRRLYPKAVIKYIFHRGLENLSGDLMKVLVTNQVISEDISEKADGFSVYDDCDLHIGFRVHAHIYNLSMRHLSVLLEEDGRGFGVNDALGLPHTSMKQIIVDGEDVYEAPCIGLEKQINYILHRIETSRYVQYENVFRVMSSNFEVMKNYIASFEGKV